MDTNSIHAQLNENPISQTQIIRHTTSDELVTAAAASFCELVTTAQENRGIARIALTGGTNGIALLTKLADADLRWQNIEFYWGDDRFVTSSSDDRNQLQAERALLAQVPVDPLKIFPIAASDGECGTNIAAAAARYNELLTHRATFNEPLFDLHLLGMGGEGHINSLFPHEEHLYSTDYAVAVTNSPKPPAQRISLTHKAINASREVWFLASGADKAEAVAAGVAHADADLWPCAGAIGLERTRWFIDTAAGSLLP